MTATFESLMGLCERIAPPGQSALTPFWVDQARRLYEGSANTLIAECGRGSIKSGFGSRVALNEVVCGDFAVPPGETHFWIDVSENKAEASQRLSQYEEWCQRLGITFEKRGDAVVLPAHRRGWLVRAAEVGRMSGFRGLGLRIDEAAKLPSVGADPLRELWASGTAMLVSHVRHRPKRMMLSSPLALIGFFNELARRGDTADQIVAANVPTWTANPSISEEDTRQLERDPDVWQREYAAIPSDSVTGNWFGDSIDASIDEGRTGPRKILDGVQAVISVDQAFSEKGDEFGWAVCTSEVGDWDRDRNTRKPRVTIIHEAGAWRVEGTPTDMLVKLKNEVLCRYRKPRVCIDQFGAAPLSDLFLWAIGFRPEVVPWTPSGPESKTERYRAVRIAMMEGRFRLPNDPALLHELRLTKGVLAASAHERIVNPHADGGHCDRASAVIHAGSVALAAPVQIPREKITWQEQLEEDDRDQQWRRLFAAMGGGGEIAGSTFRRR